MSLIWFSKYYMHCAEKEKKVRQKPGDRIGVLPGKMK